MNLCAKTATREEVSSDIVSDLHKDASFAGYVAVVENEKKRGIVGQKTSCHDQFQQLPELRTHERACVLHTV